MLWIILGLLCLSSAQQAWSVSFQTFEDEGGNCQGTPVSTTPLIYGACERIGINQYVLVYLSTPDIAQITLFSDRACTRVVSSFPDARSGDCLSTINSKFTWECSNNCDLAAMAICSPTIEIPNNNLEAQLNFVGSGGLLNANRDIQLTGAVTDLTGGVFWKNAVPTANFELQFQFFSMPSGSFAEGGALVFTTSGTAIGTGGQGLGSAGLAGVALRIDTFANPGDPPGHFVSLVNAGTTVVSQLIPNQARHTFIITYNASHNGFNVFHGSKANLLFSRRLNLQTAVGATMFVGFTGATSGSASAQQVIRQWKFTEISQGCRYPDFAVDFPLFPQVQTQVGGTAARSGADDALKPELAIDDQLGTQASADGGVWQVKLKDGFQYISQIDVYNAPPDRFSNLLIQIIAFTGDVTTDFSGGSVVYSSPVLNAPGGGYVPNLQIRSELSTPVRGNLVRIKSSSGGAIVLSEVSVWGVADPCNSCSEKASCNIADGLAARCVCQSPYKGDGIICYGPSVLQTVVVSATASWQTVNFPLPVPNPIVVCTPEYSTPHEAVVVRIRNVGAASFDLQLQAPTGRATTTTKVACIGTNAGAYPGVEAGTFVPSAGDGWLGTVIQLKNSYPAGYIVLGQVMTTTGAAWTSFWASGMTTHSTLSTETSFRAGMLNGGATIETVGYIVLSRSTLTFDVFQTLFQVLTVDGVKAFSDLPAVTSSVTSIQNATGVIVSYNGNQLPPAIPTPYWGVVQNSAVEGSVSLIIDSTSRNHQPATLSTFVFEEIINQQLPRHCFTHTDRCPCLQSNGCVWCGTSCYVAHPSTNLYCAETNQVLSEDGSDCPPPPVPVPAPVPVAAPEPEPSPQPEPEPAPQPPAPVPAPVPAVPSVPTPEPVPGICSTLGDCDKCVGNLLCRWCESTSTCFSSSNRQACTAGAVAKCTIKDDFAVVSQQTMIQAVAVLAVGCFLVLVVVTLFFAMRTRLCAAPHPSRSSGVL